MAKLMSDEAFKIYTDVVELLHKSEAEAIEGLQGLLLAVITTLKLIRPKEGTNLTEDDTLNMAIKLLKAYHLNDKARRNGKCSCCGEAC